MVNQFITDLLGRQLTAEQRTQAWYDARHLLLTSSEAASALDYNIYETSLDLLKRKCSIASETPIKNTSSVEWGNKFEPIAKKIFEYQTGEKVYDAGLIVHKDYPWLGASPDGLIPNGKLIEIKCPTHRPIFDNKIPYCYWIQMQIQMEVCDVDECYFFQCQFEIYPATNNHPGTIYENQLSPTDCYKLKKHTLNIVTRDKKWFTENYQKLLAFWNKVLYYREKGLNQLINDIGLPQIYYDIRTATMQTVKPIQSNQQQDHLNQNSRMRQKRKIHVLFDESEEVDQTAKPDDQQMNDIPRADNLETNNEVIADTQTALTENHLRPDQSSYEIQPRTDQPLIDWKKWVSATAVRNYIMKDPILDWLNLYYDRLNTSTTTTAHTRPTSVIPTTAHTRPTSVIPTTAHTRPTSVIPTTAHTSPIHPTSHELFSQQPLNSFSQYLQLRGVEFEKAVIEYLHETYPGNVIDIISDPNGYYARQIAKVNETIDAMRAGIPIIYQGVLHNPKNKTYGIADLIIRSDWLNDLFNEIVIDEAEARIPCKFSTCYHYRIIDIKHASLALRADGTHLLNSGSIPAYKAQVLIYTKALGLIQEYTPPRAYILGNKWAYTKCKKRYYGNKWFDRLGVVDFQKIDSEYIAKTNQAIKWNRRVRHKGAEWCVTPPTIFELYPNMCNIIDYPWHTVKEEIANEIGEITKIWMCGVKNREHAFDLGIKSWRDERCNAATLGINGKKLAPIVNAILDINRSQTNYIAPRILENKPVCYNVEFFVDFETVNELLDPINRLAPETNNKVYLFMVGVGYRVLQPDKAYGPWQYINLTTPSINLKDDSDKELFFRFHEVIFEILEKYKTTNYIIYHWSHAEKTMYSNLMNKFSIEFREYFGNIKLQWYDLFVFFKNTPIVVKGAFDFSLKSIARAMHRLNLIPTCWPSDGITDGLNAMIKALECSDDARQKSVPMYTLPLMKKIISYNEIDCKVMSDILSYIRDTL